MSNHGRACRRTLLTGLLAVSLLGIARTSPAATNEVLTWNETALKAAAANGQNSIQMSRTLAMVQGAVHDALNAITRRYAAYYFEGPGEAGASPDAAVAAAAHTVLVGVIPSFGTPAQKVAALALVEDAYLAALRSGGDGAAKAKGVAVGRAAGAAMLALRKDDGATKDAPVYARDGARQVAAASEPRPAEPAHREPGAGPRLRAVDPPRLGQCHALHPALRLAVLAPRPPGADQRGLRARLQ